MNPEANPMSRMINANALDTLFQAAIERKKVPCVTAAVADAEQLLYSGAFGSIDKRGSQPATNDTLFQIKSITKAVTSAAAMMMHEQGRLDLDAPVARYLPEFSDQAVIDTFDEEALTYTTRPPNTELLVRHLITHTSGLGYQFSNRTLGLLRERLPFPPPLLHDPGERWTYGSSTHFLGKTVEAISGDPLDVFFDKHIFEPLGMCDTTFYLKPEDENRFAELFQRVDDRLVWVQEPPYKTQIYGDTGLLSTATDFIPFLQMLLGKGTFGGNRILSEASVNAMLSDQIAPLTVEAQVSAMPTHSKTFPKEAGQDSFGYGFQIRKNAEKDRRAPGSGSWAGVFNTYFWVDPAQNIAAVILMQVLPFYDDRCLSVLDEFEKGIYVER